MRDRTSFIIVATFVFLAIVGAICYYHVPMSEVKFVPKLPELKVPRLSQATQPAEEVVAIEITPVQDLNPQFKRNADMRKQLQAMRDHEEFAKAQDAFIKAYRKFAPIPARAAIDDMLAALRENFEHDYWADSHIP